MKSLTQTINDYEKISKELLKVDNPILLKTGSLGTIVNIFANMKYDAAMYYNKLLKEINVATAEDFSSLLFHSTIYDYTLDFAIPAKFDITFIVPDIRVEDNQLITYTIEKNKVIKDSNGFDYIIESPIDILINKYGVQGKAYTNDGLIDLKVDKVKNPNNENTYIYLVTFDQIKQYKREFFIYEIPEYDIGDNVSYSIPINMQSIYSLNAWYLPTDTTNQQKQEERNINNLEAKLHGYYTEEIPTQLNANALYIKYTKHNSNQYDNDIFFNIKDSQIDITLGDGYNGQKRNSGEILILEVKTTKGEEGNLTSTEWVLNNIKVSSESDLRLSNTSISLKAVSLNGGYGGISFSDIDTIKRNLMKKITGRNSLISLNDFENHFELENGKPFVDVKYLNSKSNLFIFNILRDFNKKIIPTNTFNIKETNFDQNLFFPEINYKNENLISPFYYKKRNNHYDAYLINPKVKINLNTNEPNKIVKITNMIDCYLTYDYVLRKSKIELFNTNANYTYIFSCNLFTMTLNKDNNFQFEISNLFTDLYCLIDEELTKVNDKVMGLTDINIQILNKFIIDSEIPSSDNSQEWQKIYLMNWYSDESYFQLKYKQSNFLYIETDEYNTNKETRYILNLPYLKKSFFDTNNSFKIYNKLDSFFKVNEDSNLFPFNISVCQSFYNTIDLPEKYKKYIINIDNSSLDINTRIKPYINIIVDRHKFNLSDYQNIEDFENDLKLFLISLFASKEGSYFEYFESYIENNCLKNFDIIKNIEVLNPKSTTTNNRIKMYNLMEEDLNKTIIDETTNQVSNLLTVKDLIDFVPTYFYFDFDNMYIKIIMD